ncbi:MAG: segregation/condensation protein A [Chitinispirillaceae bacterium]|nr:segregation/condensation protein A [Chitinispirillaceae bacterium]
MPLKRDEYEVKLELFEGPLDLLLYLVNKSEVNIVDISVSQVVAQYLEYLDLLRELNINVAAEYLHMAATLVRLKARELLPPGEGEPADPEEEGIYNRDQLIAQLLEYKKFKEAANTLRTFESEHYGAFSRGSADVVEHEPTEKDVDLGSISIFDLLAAFKKVLERSQTSDEQRHVVEADTVKIDERIERILGMLCDSEEVRFEALFEGDMRKIVVVVTFMAILELVKMQEISFRQEESFGTIFVVRRPGGSVEEGEVQGVQGAPPAAEDEKQLRNHADEEE